ncbi:MULTISPECIES: TetR/AcrR family transcriptional regulator [Variovorax]|uniref:TetR/AcrR family transcriptional regulator n=1 Tax=Variovorax TaxID=34072 RepID=UPI00086FA3FB|nr:MULTISPECIES: TetR/AcrR family transcriptional regulator [Variovorax]MBN8757622.1 TetR/AcrR family transcriptional regulator [Variovorax sp.]ODU13238.1 MAG: TetR family transcriptional regulator [Variovorax sp. SCN 67-85]ODV22036.1 MAG: TetR family transcriptional regulator [Variovorax sp. SCN 67-20]OJZ07749.1 MAG: TetR family transcriptional regulator [Variovorax sp. 67-131]UKI10597.1 TetR/AcrR family transcriptional regulator [Variovorax paradoxus]
MTTEQRTKKQTERVPKARVDKFSERRAELGEAALTTLAALGYARTSLREIAQNSEFSHGVLHYYFTDKIDLIICSVKQYKARCVTRYDHAVDSATTCDELMEGFLQSLADTLRDEGHVHRLWYDLRSQALFEEAFRSDVVQIDKSLEDMIWRIMSRFAELSGEDPGMTPSATYALFDGLFQQALLKHLSGDAGAVAAMQADVRQSIVRLFSLPAKAAPAARKRAAATAKAL